MLQALANGLAHGLIFAVIGIAFSLVYATTRVFFIALGAICAITPYLVLQGSIAGLPWALCIVAAVVAAAGLSVVCEETIHHPLERKAAPQAVHFIASLGAYLVLAQVILLVWGADVRVLRAGVDHVFTIGFVRLTWTQIIGATGAGGVLTIFFVSFRSTAVGLQLRALASNATLLATIGRDVRFLRRVAFALAGLLAAAASILMAVDVGFDPHVGFGIVLVGIAAAVIGGPSSLGSVAVAGLLIGLLRAQVVWHTSARWEDAATFAILALSLLLFPEGVQRLAGRRTRIESAP